MRLLTMVLVVSAFLLMLTACQPIDQARPSNQTDGLNTDGKLQKFESKEEILSYLQEQNEDFGFSYGFVEAQAFSASADSIQSVASESTFSLRESQDFSQTNVQVRGVDEPDIVKNDGKYVYALVQDKLVIVDAFPAENAKIVSETEVDGNPYKMFVNDDNIIVFSEHYASKRIVEKYSIFFREREFLETLILIYDVSDKTNPSLIKNFSIEGEYIEARMIEDIVYFLTKQRRLYSYFEIPVLREQGQVVSRSEVYHFDNFERSYVMSTIGSIDLDSMGSADVQTFLMGDSNAIYVSPKSFYVAYRKSSKRDGEKELREAFIGAMLPSLPSEIGAEIEGIMENSDLSEEVWVSVSEKLQEFYESKTEEEIEEIKEKAEKALQEYLIEKEKESMKSIIHKFSLEDGKISYKAKGEVPGTLLNQFSMDEHGDKFRVATHTNLWVRGLDLRGFSVTHNNVYVLDDELNLIGELEGIAPDERIFSTRFMGDRLYMVTFRNVDPFFVIDLSDDNPEILGELKIPGFSDYLHPYDENRIIGVGKETKESDFGGFSAQGVKLALFDVSDVSSPEQVDKIEIGDSGSHSEALRDHKAFLFDKEKNLVVLPMDERTNRGAYDIYLENYWQGAYVLTLDESGFEVRGKIHHGNSQERYYSPYRIRRSLYIDDVLYTISTKTIKANDLNNPSKEISSIDLPYKRILSPVHRYR